MVIAFLLISGVAVGVFAGGSSEATKAPDKGLVKMQVIGGGPTLRNTTMLDEDIVKCSNSIKVKGKNMEVQLIKFGGTDTEYATKKILRQATLPKVVRNWMVATLRVKLIKIGAKAVCHARYVIFQMAEVAISKELFAAILGRIGKFRFLVEASG